MQITFQILMAILVLLNVFAVYVGVMTLFTFKRRVPYPDAAPTTRFAVLIAARNERQVLPTLIDALHAQNYPADRFDIIVAANNCTDDTADVARQCGAKVFSCTGEIHCKGDVLHQVIDALMPQNYDAFVIFDADNVPDPDFLQRMNDAFCAGERVCKGRLKAGNASESWVSGGYGLFHALMEWTYSRPHAAAGFSSNLVGTAFAFHREVMEKMGGWNTFSLCEDSEFAAQCSRLGYRVAWVYEAMSYDEQVAKLGTSLRQRHRWCYGMVQTARAMVPSMFRRDCPKKGMARDFGVLLILSHTAPLSCLVGLVAMIFQPPWAWIMVGAGTVLSYIGLVLAGFLFSALGGYETRRILPAIFMFPIFMATWMPVQLAALFIPVKSWSAIRHNGQPDAR